MKTSTKDIDWALAHFHVSQPLLQQTLTTALAHGGQFADLFFEHTNAFAMTVRDGEVSSCSRNVDYGVGVRCVANEHTGYAYCEEITADNLLHAAEAASQIANTTATQPSAPFQIKPYKNHYAITTPLEQIEVTAFRKWLELSSEWAHQQDSRVVKLSAAVAYKYSHILIATSDGVLAYDFRPITTFSVQCVMMQNGHYESSSEALSYRMGAEFFSDDMVKNVTSKAVKKTARLFDAVQPKGGEMTVVMGAGSSGILLHEAIGHAFEADFNRKNTSIFSNKLGKSICSSDITIIDSGIQPQNRGAVNVDDEGIAGQETVIVDHGTLSSYLHDRISAAHYGVEPTGNGRRDNFRQPPVPRMRSTYMLSGEKTADDLIKDVKQGIFLSDFSNGQVNIGVGDFTFYARFGYLIENGQLTQPVKDINVIGNGPQALADITAVADNLEMANSTWMCGKAGQNVPVCCGMPTVTVKKMMVG
ncbi:MAG: TldD/PmbA family protein [Bacteroidales bacterium]|nr:TldD/PmbA family protein [Bacteroidales bacterium]